MRPSFQSSKELGWFKHDRENGEWEHRLNLDVRRSLQRKWGDEKQEPS